MWIAFLLVFVLGVLAFIVTPLFRPAESWEVPGKQSELDRLLDEKARTLRTLKDLASEFRAELMDEASYDAARQEYIHDAVELNRDIAKLTGTDPSRMQDEGIST